MSLTHFGEKRKKKQWVSEKQREKINTCHLHNLVASSCEVIYLVLFAEAKLKYFSIIYRSKLPKDIDTLFFLFLFENKI